MIWLESKYISYSINKENGWIKIWVTPSYIKEVQTATGSQLTWSLTDFPSQHSFIFNIDSQYCLVSLRSIFNWNISSTVFLESTYIVI